VDSDIYWTIRYSLSGYCPTPGGQSNRAIVRFLLSWTDTLQPTGDVLGEVCEDQIRACTFDR